MTQEVTKILFIDQDETAFQFRKCMAKVLGQLPPVELFHATDATEALQLLEQLRPDVVVPDDDTPEERDLFIDSLAANHPPIVVQTDGEIPAPKTNRSRTDRDVTYIRKTETLEGIHETLIVAAALATKDSALLSKLPS